MSQWPSWDDIAHFYIDLTTYPRYEALGFGMLDLVQRLRDDPGMVGVLASTSHAALTLEFPQQIHKVIVIWDSPKVYSIYFDHQGDTPETFFGEMSKVRTDQIIQEIHNYLRRLKD